MKSFILYSLSGGISYFIDYLIFNVLDIILRNFIGPLAIILSGFIARVLSSIFNYCINKNKVFKISNGNNTKYLIKYYTLVIIQLIISVSSVYLLKIFFDCNELIFKIIIDIILFIINFIIQKNFIFKNDIA